MAKTSESIRQLTGEFAKMPGIGVRTAERLAYYVQSITKDEARKLVEAVRVVKTKAKTCSVCCSVTESDPCPICADSRRDRSLVCVVERARDLGAIESSGEYQGMYHVLGGRIAPLDNVHPENLSIDRLLRRVKEGGIDEVIIATNPDTEGEVTANFLIDNLAPFGVRVSMLARGVPAGGQLEHAAKGTLAGALTGRRAVSANTDGSSTET
jgi:recombination protein RecR